MFVVRPLLQISRLDVAPKNISGLKKDIIEGDLNLRGLNYRGAFLERADLKHNHN